VCVCVCVCVCVYLGVCRRVCRHVVNVYCVARMHSQSIVRRCRVSDYLRTPTALACAGTRPSTPSLTTHLRHFITIVCPLPFSRLGNYSTASLHRGREEHGGAGPPGAVRRPPWPPPAGARNTRGLSGQNLLHIIDNKLARLQTTGSRRRRKS
jgi:hypothetical protein